MTISRSAVRVLILPFLLVLALCPPASASSEEALCAQVKIEIEQELTLERQAFDAHMRINNGLTHASLEDIRVDVWFTDEDGASVSATSDSSDTDALFYIRVDSMDEIDDVDGSGTVAPDTSADIHWLIIPATGASNGISSGTYYNVGATLTYTMGGEENVIEVTPDYIFVKPMPELELDYFLPENVYGDDAFTEEIEPSIPFSLGVRVKNNGSGSAQSLQIESAQPKIVDNDQGLLISFYITGVEVNGESTDETLLVDFGTIDPNDSGTARWIMTTSVSGRFVEFEAEFTHSDELGGELTSLIEGIDTHFLVQDVLVDLSGRDSIRDFLAKSDTLYTVYESEGHDTSVTDHSDAAVLGTATQDGAETHHTLTTPVDSGFIHVMLADPHDGDKTLTGALRSDGKVMPSDNAWQSKVRNQETLEWEYYIHLFDADTTGSYTLVFEDAESLPQAPVIQYIPDKEVNEEQQCSFIVQSSDPNGTIPALSASPLPVGAEFTDLGDGTATFDWTPQVGQKGTYAITYTASDGSLETDQTAEIQVFDVNDTDMDGMTDDWELSHFGDLSRDGTLDFDGDGVTDLQEYEDETDPALDENAPSEPAPLSPSPDEDVTDTEPELVIQDSEDNQNDDIEYEFEIYSDEEMTELVASASEEAQLSKTLSSPVSRTASRLRESRDTDTYTTWEVPATLADNTRYYWRVRSQDTDGSSLWAYWDFFVNTENDPPQAFAVSSPEDGTQVQGLAPDLSVTNSEDPDQESLTYTFEIYEDDAMTILAVQSPGISQGADGVTAWTPDPDLADNTWYYWRAVATDPDGDTGTTALSSFYTNTANQAPEASTVLWPDDTEEVETLSVSLSAAGESDPESATMGLIFEIDTVDTFDGTEKKTSGWHDQGTDETTWTVDGLEENTRYYWRVKADDGSAQSSWAGASFYVNQMNEAPSVPTVKNPGPDAWVDTQTPTLSLHSAVDPDDDTLEYVFEIYENDTMTRFVVQGESADPLWTVTGALDNNTRYYWRAQALDEHGVSGDWTELSDFFVKTDSDNEAPSLVFITPGQDLYTNADTLDIQWTADDPDSNALISVYLNSDEAGDIPVAEDIEEDSGLDSLSVDISGLSEGTYTLFALIADEDSEVRAEADGSIIIDRTPPEISLSHDPGNYDGPFTLTVTTDEAADIYYTIDGTTPDQTGLLFDTSLEIDGDAGLKFIAYDQAGNAGEVIEADYVIGSDVFILTVTDDDGTPVTGVNVYAFETSGSYAGITTVTDDQGQAAFDSADFSEDEYLFRIDYLGYQFWSDTVTIPQDSYLEKIIPMEQVTVTVSTTNGVAQGCNVYVYSENGSYVSLWQVTDGQGMVSFTLPTGVNYVFRADVLGTEFYTDPVPIQDETVNSVELQTGGGLLTVVLKQDELTPMAGIDLYLFSDGGAYLGESGASDDLGQVSFEVPQADYMIRADYLGHQFWSGTIHVAEDIETELILIHRESRISVKRNFQERLDPLAGLKVELFCSSGFYVGLSTETDDNGDAFFSVPDKAFKVRVNYLQAQYWSEEFTFTDTEVVIPMAQADLTVTGAGLPQSGIPVYLFNDDSAYLNLWQSTDDHGRVSFTIPEDIYLFRADYEGSQFWTTETFLARDIVNEVGLSVGGGEFAFTLEKDGGEPISGIKSYVFTESGSYIGLNGATDTDGQVYFDLADGTYQIRVDYLVEQFWSDPVTVPDTFSATLTLDHEPVRVTVTTCGVPISGAKVYLFSEAGSYADRYGDTDTDGMISFDLPVGGSFKFRADILGTQYWTDALLISQDNAVTLETGGGHVSLTLQADDQTPISDTKVYLFQEYGYYTGLNQVTDSDGRAGFDVSEAAYTIRADYLGYQFRTDAAFITTDTDITLEIPHNIVQIHVTDQGADLSGATVYLFNESSSYQSRYQVTDEQGMAEFSLPDGYTYKLRVDYDNQQFWTDNFVSADGLTLETEVSQ